MLYNGIQLYNMQDLALVAPCQSSCVFAQDVEVLPTFDALGLKEDLLRGVYAYGFERPGLQFKHFPQKLFTTQGSSSLLIECAIHSLDHNQFDRGCRQICCSFSPNTSKFVCAWYISSDVIESELSIRSARIVCARISEISETVLMQSAGLCHDS